LVKPQRVWGVATRLRKKEKTVFGHPLFSKNGSEGQAMLVEDYVPTVEEIKAYA